MSGEHTGSQLHTDPDLMGAWSLLMSGAKWWVIIPTELPLEEIDFPLDIKICAEPAFDESAIVDAGYGSGEWSQYDYFTGRSRFNGSIFGWAGHTPQAGPVGSVEEVLDKVRNHKVADIVEFVQFDFNNEKILRISFYRPLHILHSTFLFC